MLIDGQRIASATLGTTALENIPLSQIERIEIVPGPVSGLYGSDAIGGVIQIFTKSGRYSPGMNVTAGIGTYNTRSLSAALSSHVNDTDFTVSAAHFDTDGFSAAKPTISFGQYNPDKDGYRNSNFSGKAAHRFNPNNELGATLLYSKGNTHFDSGPTTDDAIRQTLSAYSLYSQNQITSIWQSLVRIGSGRDDSVSSGAYPSEFRTEQDQATWQNTFKFGNSSLIAGAEYLGQKVTSTTSYPVSKRNVRSAFVGYRGDFGNHGVQADLRRDDSQFGRPATGSLAYGYRLTQQLKLRAAYGTAFHAPTFNDLYFPDFGNAALLPERSRNREIGIDYQAGQQRFAASYFDNRITDLIVFAFDPVTSNFGPVNIDKARIRGTELSYQGNLLNTQLRAKLTLQDPEGTSGLQLQRRAKRHGSFAATRAFGAWQIGAELVASGERFDSNNEAAASRLAGYAVANLLVTRSFSPNWLLVARWNNIADKDYELAQGYNTPGSNVFVSLKWTPGK